MGFQKQKGKNRLDKWYKLAKERGYRARAAFKLIQLNRKFGILEASKVVIDLCAAPGSWCQVAAETMPQGSLIVGVDLAPIKAIPKAITFQADITTDKCRSMIRSHLKTWKADTVLHDGAPNVGVAWIQDAYSQAELVLEALRLATDFLAPNGSFITKVFRSKDYNALIWIFNQLFDRVDSTKPPASRDVSAEIFVVCRGYKAPKRIDPKLLDARSVFAELAAGRPNHEAKVFNPSVKKRHRDGYEEGDYLLFKETTATEFLEAMDPIAILGTYNKFTFADTDKGEENVTLQALDKLEITSPEIRSCCRDLKVLGRQEFKKLLKWRLKAREILGFNDSRKNPDGEEDDEKAEVEPMDEELEAQKVLEDLKETADHRKKRARRRENEQKRKDIVRMEMNMEAPLDIGVEQTAAKDEAAMFTIRTAQDPNTIKRLARGRMATVTTVEKQASRETESESEEEDGDTLDAELDTLYEQYQERKSMVDATARSKRMRMEDPDGEWHGIESNDESDSEEMIEEEVESEEEDESDFIPQQPNGTRDGLSHKAQAFFAQDLFKDIDGISNLEDGDSGIEMNEEKSSPEDVKTTKTLPLRQLASTSQNTTTQTSTQTTEEHDSDPATEESSAEESEVGEENNGLEWEELPATKQAEPSIEIITAEAMTLAQQIASGQKTTADIVDDAFDKYSLRDVDGLPDWFLDDERHHSKRNRPITSQAAAAIKEKQRLLNARPIKKVMEAKGRKKMRAAKRMEKLRKKSSLLADDEGLSERDKAQNIAKVMSKAARKNTKPSVKLVVARGGNRGISGRPKGVKGKYKIVDPRLKKDTRALKRIAKSKKR